MNLDKSLALSLSGATYKRSFLLILYIPGGQCPVRNSQGGATGLLPPPQGTPLDIIDRIIYTPGSCHQNSNQWQYNIIVMCLSLYHVTGILYRHWREFWSRDTDVYLTYIRFGITLTQFYVNSSRQERQIDVLYMYRSTPENLRFHPIPPFIFPLQSLYYLPIPL